MSDVHNSGSLSGDREFRPLTVDLTRLDIRRGMLYLPRRFHDALPEGDLEAEDTAGGVKHSLRFTPPRQLEGLKPFFETHELRPNDGVSLFLGASGLRLTPIRRERRPSPPAGPQLPRADTSEVDDIPEVERSGRFDRSGGGWHSVLHEPGEGYGRVVERIRGIGQQPDAPAMAEVDETAAASAEPAREGRAAGAPVADRERVGAAPDESARVEERERNRPEFRERSRAGAREQSSAEAGERPRPAGHERSGTASQERGGSAGREGSGPEVHERSRPAGQGAARPAPRERNRPPAQGRGRSAAPEIDRSPTRGLESASFDAVDAGGPESWHLRPRDLSSLAPRNAAPAPQPAHGGGRPGAVDDLRESDWIREVRAAPQETPEPLAPAFDQAQRGLFEEAPERAAKAPIEAPDRHEEAVVARPQPVAAGGRRGGAGATVEAYLRDPSTPAIVRANAVAESLGLPLEEVRAAMTVAAQRSEGRIAAIRPDVYLVKRGR